MTATSAIAWLDDCEFRHSYRAKRLRISVSPRSGVVVTLPPGISRARALAFVETQREWIERQLARLPPPTPPGPPERVALPALGLDLAVHFVSESRERPHLRETCNGLYLTGDWRTHDVWRTLFTNWLRTRAHAAYLPVIAEQAERMGLRHGRVSVRLQRTRWGSCNRHGDISLNAKLLLLSPALMRHVIIHELAHIRHLDHSPAFWAVVEAADPAWRSHRRALCQASSSLPGWLEH
ncbi:hypothetical protein BI364_04440 [Acidihalobacter yilgarnensis]|uniref:YgjP-like metallopeptidase domain-containing protein n=1 Tax=Acidihalobacter yilgarnensis TaxID=2819280 RepID=A0A1D8ILK3_9GAMM|nr:SprT family zinc-dependent metalloprotease [Acidihalobacter yilgarnensis]AOU97339.1 hypothetical protein BI364_04440 [Acidihalobacter yilgarnensis]